MTKYKYYFKKPKSEITKDIFKTLLISGMLCIAATSPYFIQNLIKGFKKCKKLKKYNHKKIYNTFYKLKRDGNIRIKSKNGQIYISLTEKGKKMAGWMQIDDLEIKKPKKWDGKWRLVAFDIAQPKLIYREALRGKLKELGFYQFQKSIWIYPYNCKDEIGLLTDFFGFSDEEVQLITAESLKNGKKFKELFKL